MGDLIRNSGPCDGSGHWHTVASGDAVAQRILVTGGAGFIGSALVRYLMETTDADVAVVDKLTYAGNLDSLATIAGHSRYRFFQHDIVDAAAIAAVFHASQPSAVIHLAAESHVDRSIADSGQFIQTNVVGTQVLLDTALTYWRGLPASDQQRFRFLHVSTDEVYGDLPDQAPPFTEQQPYQPSSPYAASKAASDHLVRAWHRTYGLPTLVSNCSNNYGPYQFPEKLIPHMILSALQERTLPLYGDGQQIRDWLYVEDHVAALWQIVQRGAVGETYNIGGNSEHRNIDVVMEICRTLMAFRPPKSVRHYQDLISHVRDRPGHDRRYAVDCSKLQRSLGWEPQLPFNVGLRRTVQWYLDNETWWRRVLSGEYRLTRLG